MPKEEKQKKPGTPEQITFKHEVPRVYWAREQLGDVMSKRSLFGRSKAIEHKIDEFVDKVSEAGLVVVATLHHSLDSGATALDQSAPRHPGTGAA